MLRHLHRCPTRVCILQHGRANTMVAYIWFRQRRLAGLRRRSVDNATVSLGCGDVPGVRLGSLENGNATGVVAMPGLMVKAPNRDSRVRQQCVPLVAWMAWSKGTPGNGTLVTSSSSRSAWSSARCHKSLWPCAPSRMPSAALSALAGKAATNTRPMCALSVTSLMRFHRRMARRSVADWSIHAYRDVPCTYRCRC